LKASTR